MSERERGREAHRQGRRAGSGGGGIPPSRERGPSGPARRAASGDDRVRHLLSIDDLSQDTARPAFKRFLPYTQMLDAFAQALEQGRPFSVPGEEGLRNQLVLDAAYRSLQTGRAESPGPS